MHFQAITKEDLGEIRRLQPEGWTDIVPEFDLYIRKSFCHPLKVMSDSKLAGIGASIVFGRTCWLAHIIVERSQRRKGIGSAITEKLIRDLDAEHIESFLLIATEAGFPVYLKAGFRVMTEYRYFKRVSPTGHAVTSPDVRPCQKEQQKDLLELDRKISGEDRSPLLSDYLDNALVYTEAGRVHGFYIPGLGEGPVVAETPDAGLELMRLKYSKAGKAVIPSDNTEGTAFLENNGFVPAETRGTRMILGKDLEWMPEGIFGRIGGNFG